MTQSHLQDLEHRLQLMQHSLAAFGVDVERLAAAANPHAADEPPPDDDYERAVAMLTPEQRRVYDFVMEHLEQPQRTHMRVGFVEAFAGGGKTFVGNTIASTMRARGETVVCSAYTAKAAANYRGGTTAHYAFCLRPTQPHEKPTVFLVTPGTAASGASRGLAAGLRLRAAAVAIIDEVGMMRAGELDAIAAALGDVGFTGVLLLLGNNAQLAPVLEHATTADIIKHHVTSSATFRAADTRRMRLTHNQRMADDAAFLDACTRIGYGDEPAVDGVVTPAGAHRVRLPTREFNALPATDANVAALRQWAHPTMYEAQPHYVLDDEPSVIICPTRAYERQHNRAFLDMLPGEDTLYAARDEVVPKAGQRSSNIMAECIGDDLGPALDQSGVPYAELCLRPGAPVQLMQTLDASEGLIKGVNAVVQRCDRHSVVIRLKSGALHRIPRTTFQYTPKKLKGAVEVQRHQLPLALNWASTVHRVQGDTLERVVFDLRHGVFCHGQLYTGITRVRRSSALRMLIPPEHFEADGRHFLTTNIVLHCILGREELSSAE